MSTDPWCRKCPFHMVCLSLEIEPQSMMCESNRWSVGHLNAEDTWLIEFQNDLEELFPEMGV